MRERLSGRLGFILLSAGCAIGLGNVWRFPYVAGRYGGGCFVLVYLVCLAALGLPLLTMEFALGRASRRSVARLHGALTPEKPLWRLHGPAAVLGNVVLMMFYTTVAGWMAIYCVRTATGALSGLGPDGVAAAFGAMLGSPGLQAAATSAVCLSAAAVCAIGLQRGLERVTKAMMLCLLALIVALAANSMRLEGAGRGIAFYLVPDFAGMRSVGVLRVVVEAMNQAFFTLSLGIGAMSIFGSYIGRDRTLLGEAASVCALDTAVALTAGLAILPACFAYGVEPGQGPGLVFVTLPNVFGHMPFGRLWGTLFFAFMSFAALTTVFAVFETIVACLRDYTGWSRGRACAVVAVAMPALSLPCVLGFSVWSSFRPFGPGSGVLDLEDFVVTKVLLPLGAFAFAGYCSWRCGWGWDAFRAEANAGGGPRVPAALRAYCAWVLPALVAVLFALGLGQAFAG